MDGDKKMWVAINLTDVCHGGWVKGRKRLTRNQVDEMQAKNKIEIDLNPYGFDFWMVANVVGSWMAFEKKEDMLKAEEEGFDKCIIDGWRRLNGEED